MSILNLMPVGDRSEPRSNHRRSRIQSPAGVLLAIALVVAACGDGAISDETTTTPAGNDIGAPTTAAVDQGDLESVTLMLPFLESLSFFSPLLAQDLGYFEEEGLEVEIAPSDGGSVALQQVISGNQDLALVSPGLIITAVAEGNQLVVPYTDKHRNLFSVVVPTGSELKTMEQLKGKVLGITDFGGGELPLARAALERAGLIEDVDVELLVVGEGGPGVLSAFENGDIDAYAASWSDFFPMITAGMELQEIIQPELSSLPSEVLVVTPDYAAEHPDVIEGVTRAMAKASYFTTYDPDAALNLLRERIPEEHEDPMAAREALKLWINIADVPIVDGAERYGGHDEASWETFKEVLSGTTDVSGVDISTILDSSFLDSANDFDRAEIEQEADELNLSYP